MMDDRYGQRAANTEGGRLLSRQTHNSPNNFTAVYFTTADYPASELPEEQADLLRVKILQRAESNAPFLRFGYTLYIGGALMFECANEPTVGWLQQTINELWNGDPLVTVPAVYGPNCYTVALPESRHTSIQFMIDTIAEQNMSIDPKLWLLENQKWVDNKWILSFQFEQFTTYALEKQSFVLYYRGEIVRVLPKYYKYRSHNPSFREPGSNSQEPQGAECSNGPLPAPDHQALDDAFDPKPSSTASKRSRRQRYREIETSWKNQTGPCLNTRSGRTPVPSRRSSQQPKKRGNGKPSFNRFPQRHNDYPPRAAQYFPPNADWQPQVGGANRDPYEEEGFFISGAAGQLDPFYGDY